MHEPCGLVATLLGARCGPTRTRTTSYRTPAPQNEELSTSTPAGPNAYARPPSVAEVHRWDKTNHGARAGQGPTP
jgi:hypothetical protein